MIVRQPGEGAVDLVAVARDDELLGRLGARGDVAAPEDRAAVLLQALTFDVDHELAQLLAEPLALPPTDPAGTGGHRPDPTSVVGRRRAVRGTAVGLLVAAALSVGGVSAAVTGDPFTAYRSVTGLFGAGSELPPTAAAIARWNKRFATARAAVRGGDATSAQLIEALRSELAALDLAPGRAAALQRRLDRLEAGLTGAAGPGGPGGSPAVGPGRAGQQERQRSPGTGPAQDPRRAADRAGARSPGGPPDTVAPATGAGRPADVPQGSTDHR